MRDLCGLTQSVISWPAEQENVSQCLRWAQNTLRFMGMSPSSVDRPMKKLKLKFKNKYEVKVEL